MMVLVGIGNVQPSRPLIRSLCYVLILVLTMVHILSSSSGLLLRTLAVSIN